jgi:predicted O-methyltransferase YrrM
MLQKVGFYLSFLINGVTKNNINSTVIDELTEYVLDAKINYYAFIGIEHYRKILLKNQSEIVLYDLGEGSKTIKNKKTNIGALTKNVQSSALKGQLIFRLINFYKRKNILEIGTSLGLTTAYLSNGNKKGKVTTVEGDPAIYELAKQNFQKLGLQNVAIHNKSFDNSLPEFLKNKYDLIFFDGNHSKDATLKYFYWALESPHSDAIFIFDDIYWSLEMKQAWLEICSNPKTIMSVNIFSLGIVFLSKNKEKKHINLIHNCNFY